MSFQITEVEWVTAEMVNAQTFSEASGLSIDEVEDLMACGLLGEAQGGVISRQHVRIAGKAHRMRRDFELDLRGLAVAYRLLERIDELERALARPA